MIVKKYPDSLPDLDIYRRDHKYGVGLLINTPEKWCDWRTGSSYVEIVLEKDATEFPRRYFIDMEFEPRDLHYALSNQEKDQITVLFLNEAGHLDLL